MGPEPQLIHKTAFNDIHQLDKRGKTVSWRLKQLFKLASTQETKMSWITNDESDSVHDFDDETNRVDQLARKLAISAGEDWDQMANYLGYRKNEFAN